jgi:hypothetical protein
MTIVYDVSRLNESFYLYFELILHKSGGFISSV